MQNKLKEENERLWNEIHLLQAENAALRRKLGEDYRDFSYYRNFCDLEKVAEKDKLKLTKCQTLCKYKGTEA